MSENQSHAFRKREEIREQGIFLPLAMAIELK